MPERLVAFFYYLMRDTLTPGAVFDLIANARGAVESLGRQPGGAWAIHYSSPGLERCAREAVAELVPQGFNGVQLDLLLNAVYLHLDRLRAAIKVKGELGHAKADAEGAVEVYLQLAAHLATARGALQQPESS
jgi:hypothetical protein